MDRVLTPSPPKRKHRDWLVREGRLLLFGWTRRRKWKRFFCAGKAVGRLLIFAFSLNPADPSYERRPWNFGMYPESSWLLMKAPLKVKAWLRSEPRCQPKRRRPEPPPLPPGRRRLNQPQPWQPGQQRSDQLRRGQSHPGRQPQPHPLLPGRQLRPEHQEDLPVCLGVYCKLEQLLILCIGPIRRTRVRRGVMPKMQQY